MFKEIKGFENYLISDDGMVMNQDGLIMKPQNHNKGYSCISLSVSGKKHTRTIHRLVGLAFLDNPNNYPEIDHINNDKKDNRIENLRWITSSGNNRNKKFKSQYLVGVSRCGSKYRSRIAIDGYRKHLGNFNTEEEAHQEYLNKYNELMSIF